MVEEIRKNLGLTSLQFQTLPDLVEAIGLPKEDLCTHCWDGSSYSGYLLTLKPLKKTDD
jgi:amidophosphoribosyltransferase